MGTLCKSATVPAAVNLQNKVPEVFATVSKC